MTLTAIEVIAAYQTHTATHIVIRCFPATTGCYTEQHQHHKRILSARMTRKKIWGHPGRNPLKSIRELGDTWVKVTRMKWKV